VLLTLFIPFFCRYLYRRTEYLNISVGFGRRIFALLTKNRPSLLFDELLGPTRLSLIYLLLSYTLHTMPKSFTDTLLDIVTF